MIATQYIDSESLAREESDKVEVYDTKTLVRNCVERIRNR